MNPMNRIVFTLLVLACNFTFGQQQKNNYHLDTILTISPNVSDYEPLTRDTLGIWTKKMRIVGNIIDYSRGLTCGNLCGCGTVKLALTTKPKEYAPDYLYLAIPCFSNATDKIIGKELTLTVCVLDMNVDECYYKAAVINHIDSKGIPFYYPKNHEWIKIKTGANNG